MSCRDRGGAAPIVPRPVAEIISFLSLPFMSMLQQEKKTEKEKEQEKEKEMGGRRRAAADDELRLVTGAVAARRRQPPLRRAGDRLFPRTAFEPRRANEIAAALVKT